MINPNSISFFHGFCVIFLWKVVSLWWRQTRHVTTLKVSFLLLPPRRKCFFFNLYERIAFNHSLAVKPPTNTALSRSAHCYSSGKSDWVRSGALWHATDLHTHTHSLIRLSPATAYAFPVHFLNFSNKLLGTSVRQASKRAERAASKPTLRSIFAYHNFRLLRGYLYLLVLLLLLRWTSPEERAREKRLLVIF